MKYPKHLDYVLLRPWKGCAWGLARIFENTYKGKIQLNAIGHCFDDKKRPMSFTIDIKRKKTKGYCEWKKIKQ